MPGLQSCVCGAGQEPCPLQTSGSVAVLVVGLHDGGRHWVLWPGTVHDVVTMPLHVPSQPVPSPTQAGRGGSGAPTTAVQTPTLPETLHASHWPRQSLLQHTP